MTSMLQDFLKKFKILDIFVFLVPLEILSHYHNNDSSHWFREDVQWIIDKFFIVELMI